MTTPSQPKKLGLTPASVAQAARVARATGTPLPKPPGAAAPPPVTKRVGFPAIKPGEIVAADEEAGVEEHFYTAEELAEMSDAGWKPGMDVRPEEVAGIMTELKKQGSIPPIDPATPPYKFKTHEMADLPPDRQAEFKAAVDEFRAKRDAAADQAAAAARASKAPPGVRKAVAEGRKGLEVVADEEPAKAPEKKAVERAAEPEKTDASESGAVSATPVMCPNCSCPVDQNPGPPPPMEDRLAFVEALLANRRYQKRYSIYKGKLVVVVRELAPEEADIVFYAARKEAARGGASSALDILEIVARLRACLQLVSVTSSDGMINIECRLGLAPELCPKAPDFWADNYPATADPEAPAETTPWGGETESAMVERLQKRRDFYVSELLRVREYLNTELYTSEAIYRIVADTIRNFNRETARLTDNAHNPDFLEPAAK